MLAPGDIIDTSSEAHRGSDVHVEVVEPAWGAVHLREELSSQIVEAQDAGLDVDLEPILIHLAEADDVRGEARDVVDPIKVMMFPELAGEDPFLRW